MSSFAASIAVDHDRRHPDDFYPTPAPVARAMVKLEPWGPVVWEPAAGEGDIVREIEASGRRCIATDIAPRGPFAQLDFLQASARISAADICTNPPFGLAEEFAWHALALGAPRVMLLLELRFLQGVENGRPDLLHRLARVWVSLRRMPFKRGGTDGGRGGGSMKQHALFVWERGHCGPREVLFFDWKDF